jgi:hypothetical protein
VAPLKPMREPQGHLRSKKLLKLFIFLRQSSLGLLLLQSSPRTHYK